MMNAAPAAEAQPSLKPLPRRSQGFRLLCLAPRRPSFVALALQLDAAGYRDPVFECVTTPAAAMACLRSDTFDGVVVDLRPPSESSFVPELETGELLDFLTGFRSAGYAEAVVFFAPSLSDEQWSRILAGDGEVFISPHPWDSPALLPFLERAVHSAGCRKHAHKLSAAFELRLSQERDAAEELLQQQRGMISQLRSLPDFGDHASRTDVDASPAPVPELQEFYRDLLRTYVIMGSGSLTTEIRRLAETLAAGDTSPCAALQLHVEHVEQLVTGLGRRSARHVLARADLLILEVQMRLADCYLERSRTP